MTTVTFYRKDGIIIGFKVEGHAGYANIGSDIVCAAISTLAQATIMGLKYVVGIDVLVEQGDGFLSCNTKPFMEHDSKVKSQVLLATMRMAMQDIAHAYKSFIKVCTITEDSI